jgi:hypothetical protein
MNVRFFLYLFDWRIPHAQKRCPYNAGQQDDIELMADRHKLEIKQLNWDPECPLCFLHIPKNFANVCIYLLWRLALHGAHCRMVHRVGNPRPIDELRLPGGRPNELATISNSKRYLALSTTYLLHDGLENRNAQTCNTTTYSHPLQKVEMNMRRGSVNGKAKKDSSSSAREVVLFGPRRQLSHGITETPQETPGDHFRLYGGRLQVRLIPCEKCLL